MPQIADWPPTRADAQHILNQHPDAPPQHIHTCKVCDDTYWGIKHPVSHRIRSFCSKRCYHKHAESSPSFQRYRTSPKGKAMRQKVSAKNAQSERGRLRHEQRQRWHKLVISLDPSQRRKTPPNLDPWPICTTNDCHNIPRSRLATQCRSCHRDSRLQAGWRNGGKPCVICSKPLTRHRHKTCSVECQKELVRISPTHRNTRRKQRATRRARKRKAFVENVDVTVLLQWQQGRCYHCDNKIRIDKEAPHPKSLTLDHLIPLALGGPHSYANTVASCWNCNCSIKGTRAIGEQLKLV